MADTPFRKDMPLVSRELVVTLVAGALLLVIVGAALGYKFRSEISSKVWALKTIAQDFKEHPLTTAWRHDDTEFGLEMYDPRGAEGHLLASGFFIDTGAVEIRMIDLKSGKTVKSWHPDPEKIESAAKTVWQDPSRFEPQSPLPTEDGGLIFIYNPGPLVRIDACGEIVWLADGQQHHSLEVGLKGMLLVPSVGPKLDFPYQKLKNDSIAEFDPATGETLRSVSVAQILIDNGLESLLRIAYPRDEDAVHLNDVDVAEADGPFWRRGDWALSLRSLSLVLIYRPSTGKVVWHSVGPWDKQHDPDFNSDGTFSVFSNRVVDFDTNFEHMVLDRGHSNILVFGEDQVAQYPYVAVMAAENIGTPTQGRAKLLSDGDAFVEETDYGRLLRFGSDGLVWAFNNTDGERAGILNWSRYYEPGEMPDGALTRCSQG